MDKPTPIDKEVIIYKAKPIMVKTNVNGIIEYANEYFTELSEYEEFDLVGENIDMIRHPDMPKIIFNLIWEKLLKKQNTIAILKNITKSGSYYWLQAKFDFKVNETSREIQSIYAYYSLPSRKAISELDDLYKKLNGIEMHAGNTVCENYFFGLLEEQDLDYESLIETYYQYEKHP
jgi:PAS domain S-box-containing protein